MTGDVPSSSPRVAYNLADEQSVTALLKHVRHSILDAQTKDDVRDIVFELKTSHDPTLVEELQLYVDPINLTVTYDDAAPAAPKTEQTASTVKLVVQSALGHTRPRPAFVSVTATPTSSPVNPPAADVPVTPGPEVVSEVQPAVHVQPLVSAPSAEPAMDPAPPAESVSVVAEETPAPAAEMKTTMPPTAPGTEMDRIKEIKRIVNQAVGNPISLIDANNEVGREYTNALLEAMKAVGGEGNIGAAMGRLEAAFAALEEQLKSGVLPTPATETSPSEPALAPEPAVATPPISEPTPSAPEPVVDLPKSTVTVTSDPSAGYAPTPNAPTPPVEPAPEPTPEPAAAQVQPATAAPAAATGLTSVADVVSVNDQKVAADAAAEQQKAPVSSDPFMSEAVTNGLKQLLSEWKLFKSSGMFGTGPSGIEHPLYKTMQHLKMNVIITGRFEGATPEIKQSITDYMNGWRYEQGMTHEMQETFEHYLRRVIKAIIDKRTNS